ncbi:hyaluronidase-3 [Hypomesus transpacificus]|uniref:hyaluronidase-3 n=1 Tax=Hypomesus transpacificus TaxID=137520 RepID=UPI001F0871C8|nr:hyaluronidase-3 [Hypomesus transpacificus]XP_046895659.1 hyaluronidase-3 [Hypomesus transpacificus]
MLLCRLLLILPPWVSLAPSPVKAAASPQFSDTPFTVVWNMPTARCHSRHGVHLPLPSLGILANRQQSFQGQTVSLFYKNRLGLYPYLSREGRRVHGGVPQRADLRAHLSRARAQLSSLLRPGFRGLAVLDWEAWRPLWARDFGSKTAYRQLSKELVRRSHPELSQQEVTSLARKEFERGARKLMRETLRLGVSLQPGGLWGYYGFPSCFNDPPTTAPQPRLGGNHTHVYTGHCHPRTRRMNDQLAWLWAQSTALYPSIYLPRRVAGSSDAALMVRHRLLEASRLASQHGTATPPPPVLPYARLAFVHTLTFLNQTDLEHTLGESAALGAAGVVLWGEIKFARSKRQCELLRDYLGSVLGRYIQTLRNDVILCSHRRCHGNGRCARRDPLSDHMIPSTTSDPTLTPDLSHNLSDLYDHFLCQCYQGWTGDTCQMKTGSNTS